MDPEAIDQLFKTLLHTSVTKTVHRDVYPAISASNFKLHQSGKAILITGGSSGVGFSTARAFVRASASIVIIVARSSDALATAVTSLEVEAKKAGTGTKIISKSLDVSDISAVKKFWEDLEKDEISVDVYIANAAKFTEPKPILELGADEVWSQMETNAKSPLYFVEKFYAQKGETEVNVTSAAIHQTFFPIVAECPAYILSKMTGTLLFQLIALDTKPEDMQIVTFHPGAVYAHGWKAVVA